MLRRSEIHLGHVGTPPPDMAAIKRVLDEAFSALNERQREAVEKIEGPLLVLAGAGSGKTRVITVRIAYLLMAKNVDPYNILAVTFTNKAAEEMRSRVAALTARAGLKLAMPPQISTFHSLCVRILRREIEVLGMGYTSRFTIYDQSDAERLVKQCIKDLGMDEKLVKAKGVYSKISRAKNRGYDSEMFAERHNKEDELAVATARVFKLYEERLIRQNALDFDDLLIRAVQVLRKSQTVRERYNRRYRHIMVDEYQDTNSLQFALVRYLSEHHRNICVVGDEDQSIYSFRQADIRNILNFQSEFKGAEVIRLEQNYRSTKRIIAAASSVISNNTERLGKTLFTHNEDGERILVNCLRDQDDEAEYVAGCLRAHLDEEPELRAAILYRTNAQSRVFEESLRRAGLAYKIVGGISFYARAEIKDIMSYIKLSVNPNDDMALQRIINTPPRGLGKQSLDKLAQAAKARGLSVWDAISEIVETDGKEAGLSPRAVKSLETFRAQVGRLIQTAQTGEVVALVKRALEETGYAEMLKAEKSEEADGRLENLQELVSAAADFEGKANGLIDFIDHAALVSDTDNFDAEAPITLMTVHGAKGLEFPLVFMVGVEEGLFPHGDKDEKPAELEEERRLCYVAITRAEKYLYICYTKYRRIYGDLRPSLRSRFIDEIPAEHRDDCYE